MKARVTHPGFQALIQDFGRPGYREKGMPLSGALDRPSMILTNWLVGNSADAPVLEMPMHGISLLFERACQLGLAGAEAEVSLNGEVVNTNQTITVNSEDELVIGNYKKGFRAYLSITGGFKGQEFLSSYSTLVLAGVGGLGRALEADDYLESLHPEQELIVKRTKPEQLLPQLDIPRPIRFIPGPEYDQLEHYSKTSFIQQAYTLQSTSNRMGIRLKGELPLSRNNPTDLLSSPVVPGIVQLPPNGQPVV